MVLVAFALLTTAATSREEQTIVATTKNRHRARMRRMAVRGAYTNSRGTKQVTSVILWVDSVGDSVRRKSYENKDRPVRSLAVRVYRASAHRRCRRSIDD